MSFLHMTTWEMNPGPDDDDVAFECWQGVHQSECQEKRWLKKFYKRSIGTLYGKNKFKIILEPFLKFPIQ